MGDGLHVNNRAGGGKREAGLIARETGTLRRQLSMTLRNTCHVAPECASRSRQLQAGDYLTPRHRPQQRRYLHH